MTWRYINVSFIIVTGLFISPAVQARTTYQLHHFFNSWEPTLVAARDNNCSQEWNAYTDPNNEDRMAAYSLVSCILRNMTEFSKVEMAVVSVVLGLLPSILMLIGPTTAEISLLATRRPLLSLLLAVPMPSVRTAGESPYQNPATILRQPVDIIARPGILAKARIAAKTVISGCEYLLAGLAVANMGYQAYQLAYWAITISTIAVDSGPIPETYAPFLWILLIIAVHLLNFVAMKLRYRKDPERERPKSKSHFQWLEDELTPCAFGNPLWLVQMDNTYLHLLASYLANTGVAVLFIYATIILSSQIFISLGDAIPLVARWILGATVCRAILTYELHGLREVTSQAMNNVTGRSTGLSKPSKEPDGSA